MLGRLKYLRGLLHAQSAEESQLHDLRFPRIEFRQRVLRVVQNDDLIVAHGAAVKRFVQSAAFAQAPEGFGVAGDHACTDHDVAWRVRNLLGLDHLAGLPPLSGEPQRPDNIVYDITPNPEGGTGNSASGLGHPKCPNLADPAKLHAVRP